MKQLTFKPTRTEVRSIRKLAKWCEEAAGTDRTINGVPSAQVWSRFAFSLSAHVAKRAAGGAA